MSRPLKKKQYTNKYSVYYITFFYQINLQYYKML